MEKNDKSALVFGGGGMFGAYQAGVWSVLQDKLEFDLLAGASIGAVNAWAAAANCPGGAWIDEWLRPEMSSLLQWRWPRHPLGGCIQRDAFERSIQDLHARLKPVKPCAVAITDVLRRRARAVLTPDVEWHHLAASCALPGIFPLYRVDGRLTMDGGLLGSVPLWAAVEQGATTIVAVNLLPSGGPWWLRSARQALLSFAHPGAPPPAAVKLLWIEPAQPLGTARDALVWTKSNAERWIDLGRRDAERALQTF
ncbi:patatin-like phospholipase family protein [Paludibaculum fermentans]|uniref:patatin-like phospholipase family protein n=1 Tax=Paludibaculum fermentans TaxID=1473598 RepID=UPI003EBE388F